MVIANDERVEAVADAKFSPVIGRGQWRGLKQRFSKLGLGNVERSSMESRPNGGKGIVVLVVGRLDACPPPDFGLRRATPGGNASHFADIRVTGLCVLQGCCPNRHYPKTLIGLRVGKA